MPKGGLYPNDTYGSHGVYEHPPPPGSTTVACAREVRPGASPHSTRTNSATTKRRITDLPSEATRDFLAAADYEIRPDFDECRHVPSVSRRPRSPVGFGDWKGPRRFERGMRPRWRSTDGESVTRRPAHRPTGR